MPSETHDPVYVWPAEPYKGLSYYGPEDQPLYAGRDADIRRCADLLMMPNTRMLILHGRTGCGKSSFLRAGLIPNVERYGFSAAFHREADAGRGNVVFIRCTNAPLRQLAEEVFRLASEPIVTETAGGPRTIDLRGALQACPTLESFCEAAHEDGFLLASLLKIAGELPYTLLFVLDQAEEVLTLNPENAWVPNQIEFFTFLQDFGPERIDLKLVISLRTEYYGRFYSAMNFDSRVGGDAKEYLLEDFTKEMLVEAIERPTSREPVEPWPAPAPVYRFRFEPGLPRRIAKDLAESRQGGSLPVMQIACKSLYDQLSPVSDDSSRLITHTTYDKLGGVDGRVEEHIGKMLQAAFRALEVPLKEKERKLEERKWRTILCRLATLHPDGTATTNALTAAVLEVEARKQKSKANAEKMLTHLASPDVQFLRRMALSGNQEAYTLGHDVLGLSLHRWRSRTEGETQHEEQIWLIQKWICIAAIVIVIMSLGGAIIRNATAIEKDAEQLVKQSDATGKTDYQLGLLLAVAADQALSNNHHLYMRLDLVKPRVRVALLDALTSAPAFRLLARPVAQAARSRFLQDSSVTGRFALVVSGERAVAYDRGGYFQAIEVDLSEVITVLNTEKPSRDSQPFFLGRSAYWSSDGTTPLFATGSQLQFEERGSVVSIPVGYIKAHVRGLHKSDDLQPFGWERIIVPRVDCGGCSDPVLIRTPDSPLAFRLDPGFGDSRSDGNRFAVLIKPKAGALNIVNVSNGGHNGLKGTESGGALSFDFGPGATNIVAFGPDDRTLAILASDKDHPATNVGVYAVDYHGGSINPTLVPVEKDHMPVLIAAGLGGDTPLLATQDRTGELTLRYPKEQGGVRPTRLFGVSHLQDFKFTSGGKRLVGIAQDGALFVWSTDLVAKRKNLDKKTDAQLIELACKIAGRDLTGDEASAYLTPKSGTPCPNVAPSVSAPRQ